MVDQVHIVDEEDGFESDEGAEDASFLQPEQRASRIDRNRHAKTRHSYTQKRASASVVIIAATALLLAFDMVNLIPMAPRMAIYEDILCHKQYRVSYSQPVSEDCKIDAIQSELAFVSNWHQTFDSIPGIIASIPYGALADRIGRDKSLVLALVGCILSESWVILVCWMPDVFSLRAIWMSGFFQLVGGGGAIVVSMLHTMIGDVCAPEERTAAFSKAHAAALVSELISIPLASLLMSVSPWIPIFCALAVLVLTMLSVLSLSFFYAPPLPRPFYSRISTSRTSSTLSFHGPGRWISRYTDRLRGATAWITRDITYMLVAFFCCQLGRHYSSILLQYTSISFDWSYAKASYLMVLRAVGNLVVLFTALPYLSWLFTTQRGMNQNQTDKRLTIISGSCLVIGCLLIFFFKVSYAVVLGQLTIALGSAFTVTARSMLTEMAGPRNISLSFTSVTTVTYLGVIVGGPFLAALFSVWINLPFAAMATMFGVATAMVALARFREQ